MGEAAKNNLCLLVILTCLRGYLGLKRVAARLREGGKEGVNTNINADNSSVLLLITIGLLM